MHRPAAYENITIPATTCMLSRSPGLANSLSPLHLPCPQSPRSPDKLPERMTGTEPSSGLRRWLLLGTRLATGHVSAQEGCLGPGGGQAAVCRGPLKNPLATDRAQAGHRGHLAQGVITPVTFLLKGCPLGLTMRKLGQATLRGLGKRVKVKVARKERGLFQPEGVKKGTDPGCTVWGA